MLVFLLFTLRHTDNSDLISLVWRNNKSSSNQIKTSSEAKFQRIYTGCLRVVQDITVQKWRYCFCCSVIGCGINYMTVCPLVKERWNVTNLFICYAFLASVQEHQAVQVFRSCVLLLWTRAADSHTCCITGQTLPHLIFGCRSMHTSSYWKSVFLRTGTNKSSLQMNWDNVL